MTLFADGDDGVDDHRVPRTLGRRSLLAGLATTGLGLTAGCTAIVDTLADQVLGDVNLFNETERKVSGTISIKGPDGADVFSTSFDLAAQTGDEPTDGASTAYEDVWQGAGAYEVAVELGDGQTIRGESSVTETVDIEAPDEEMLAVAFGAPEIEAGIYVSVGRSLSEFHPGTRSTASPGTPGDG
jgi:hypothetical protein